MEALRGMLKNLCNEFNQYGIKFRYLDWETDFLRFFRSEVNYNISKRSTLLEATVERNKKKYSFIVSSPNPVSVNEAMHEAIKIVETLPPDPDFKSFEDNTDIADYDSFLRATETVTPEHKLSLLKKLDEVASQRGFRLFGTFVSVVSDGFIMQSNGLDKRDFISSVMCDVKAVSEKTGATVIHSFGGGSLEMLDEESFIAALDSKMKYAMLPITDAEPGEYEAILGPHAVHEFLAYLMSGAYGSAIDSGASLFEGKAGEQIFSELMTLRSEPSNRRIIRFPYNDDGHIARDVTLVESGIFKNYIMDHYYSNKLSLPKNGSVGVQALVMSPGEVPLDALISGVKRGIYISNLHYMNFINRKETSVTGLTRDGTFLIEDGKITKVLNNLRYTVKISSLFEAIIAVEDMNHTVPVSENYFEFKVFAGLVPHVRTRGFKITSSTKTI